MVNNLNILLRGQKNHQRPRQLAIMSSIRRILCWNTEFPALYVNKCQTPISATASMTVPDLGISWSHTYTSDDIVEVPGYTYSIGIFSAGVYVQVGLTDKGSTINMKVSSICMNSLRAQVKSC